MSVSDGRISRLRVTATVILALILAVLPLPHWMDIARPYLLLLLVILLKRCLYELKDVHSRVSSTELEQL